jgi:anhydro-N-acetylmuramic acid kinase
VLAAEAAGLNGDSMEAEAWAYLAVRSRYGLPLTYPGTTGVSRPVSGGRRAAKPGRIAAF